MRGTDAGAPIRVRAAGGVVIRPGPDGEPQVAVVHRPRYGDWSLPKGKLDRGETWQEAALREVAEETGLRCRALAELGPVRYTDRKGRAKLVRYWLMEAEGGEFTPNDEVDELRWCAPEDAGELLDYPADASLVGQAVAAAGQDDSLD